MFAKLCLFRYFHLVVAAAVRHPVMSLVLHAEGNTVTSGKLLISIEVVMVSIPQFGDLFYLLFVSLCFLFANSIQKAFVILSEAVVSKINGKI